MKNILLNPFEKFSEVKLLAFGIFITLIGSFLAYLFQGRFDGVIDLHFTDSVTIFQPFIDNAINIISVTIFLLIIGKIINKKTRFIDILIPSLLSRLPFYILPLANINNFIYNFTNAFIGKSNLENPLKVNIETFDLLLLLVFAAVSICILVWFVILLFNGFKLATNCKTANHKLLFAGGIILAEILSKTLIYILNY